MRLSGAKQAAILLLIGQSRKPNPFPYPIPSFYLTLNTSMRGTADEEQWNSSTAKARKKEGSICLAPTGFFAR